MYRARTDYSIRLGRPAPTAAGMLAAARQWLTRAILHRVYEDWLVARLCVYVERETAHIIAVSAATYLALASTQLVLSLFYRLTLRVADDCLRLVYIAVLALAVFSIAPMLSSLGGSDLPAPPAPSWFAAT